MISKYIFQPNGNCVSSLWKATSGYLLNLNQKQCLIPSVEIFRHRARKGTRAAALAAKKARKLQEANKPAPIPKYLQRKVKVSAELDKTRCTDENWIEDQPIDNVWNMKLYRGKPYPLSEAIDILRGMHVPSLLNEPSALVYLTTEIDLKLKKKEKFMDDFNGIFTFPHEFHTSHKNKIIVLCKEEELQQKATVAGAAYAGSTTLVKQILAGAISSDDFDYVICHPDMLKDCNALRGILKKRFPHANNGLLRLDVDQGVAKFIKGIEYNMKRSAIQPDFGWVEAPFARLDMPISEIEDNLKYTLTMIEKHKPIGISHLFLIRNLVWCERVRERLKIPHWEYLPNYPVNGILIDEDEDIETEKTG